MKFDEKKGLWNKIKIDIFIGICLGILGNSIYIYATDDLKINRLIVIGIIAVILIWLMYRKEEESSTHHRIEIPTNEKISNADIMHIRDKILDVVKNNWGKESIDTPTNSVIEFFLDETPPIKLSILRITFQDRCICLDYYEKSSEAEDYLIPKIKEILKNYKKDNKFLISEEKLINALENPIEVPGRVLYKKE